MRIRNTAAFSLLEITLVLALIILLFGIGIVAYRDFHSSIVLTSTAGDIVETLREAQQNAMGGKDASSWGVQFLSDSYVLFQGDTAEVSTNKLVFPLSYQLAFDTANLNRGIGSIVFQKMSGSTEDYGWIRLSFVDDTDRSRQISVNKVGAIQESFFEMPQCQLDIRAEQVSATRSPYPPGKDWHDAKGAKNKLIMRLYNTSAERLDLDNLLFLTVPNGTPKLTSFKARTVYNGWKDALVWESKEGVTLPNSTELSFVDIPFYHRAIGGGKLLVVDELKFKEDLPSGEYRLLLGFNQTEHCLINFALPGPGE